MVRKKVKSYLLECDVKGLLTNGFILCPLNFACSQFGFIRFFEYSAYCDLESRKYIIEEIYGNHKVHEVVIGLNNIPIIFFGDSDE